MLTHFLSAPEQDDAFNLGEEGLKLFFERKTGSQDAAVVQAAAVAYAKNIRAKLETLRTQFPTMLTDIDSATIDLSENRTIDAAGLQRFTQDVRTSWFSHVVSDNLADFTTRTPKISNEVDRYFTINLPTIKLETQTLKFNRSSRTL